MKSQVITIVTAILLIIVAENVYGQVFNSKQEEYEYYCAQAKKLKEQCQELKKQAEAEKQVQDKVANNISIDIIQDKAEGGSPSAQKTLEWSGASAQGVKAIENGQFEQAKVYVESLTPAEDYVVEITNNKEVVKLMSYRGYEAYTNSFTKSIDEYNDYLKKFQKVREECITMNSEYTKMIQPGNRGQYSQQEIKEKKMQLEGKMGEKDAINKEATRFRDEAIKEGETISGNTNDPAFKNIVDGYVKELKSNKSVSEDYKELIGHLSGCKDCGNNKSN